MNVRGAHHTGITVGNLERSIQFYRDLLGLELIGEQLGTAPYLADITGFPGVRLRLAFLRVPGEVGPILELLEYLGPPAETVPSATNRPGSAHLCFVVDDLAASYRDLSARGVELVSPGPVEITGGRNRGAFAAYLRDPDGFTVELYQPPGRTTLDPP